MEDNFADDAIKFVPLTPEMRDDLLQEFKGLNGTGEFEWAAFIWRRCQEWVEDNRCQGCGAPSADLQADEGDILLCPICAQLPD